MISLLGIVCFLLLAWLMSSNHRRIPWRIVAGGMLLQWIFGILTLRWDAGRRFFVYLMDGFRAMMAHVDAGSTFVFGERLVNEYVFAFRVLPTIIFFSSLMSILYYFGVMQLVVRGLSLLMQFTMGTSGAETLSTAGNIFLGQTEAPLLVRPYLNRMTDSELMTVMVGGFATTAGGVLAAYISFGIDGAHLLTASLMSAPATLVVAKLMQPEVDVPETRGVAQKPPPSDAANFLDAASQGAADGMKLYLNVIAMLIAFLALIHLADSMLSGITGGATTFTQIMGRISMPFAFLMGIPWSECQQAGEILGVRVIANEFIAYERMNVTTHPEVEQLSERTRHLLTYALCGFANFSSIGIQIGGLGPLAPDKRANLVRLAFRAMLGGLLACYLTACVVGLLI